MRLSALGALVVGLAALSACVHPVEPEEAAERAATGVILGTMAGITLGATFAIDPTLGAFIGGESGAAIGAVIGAVTASPIPSYRPLVPATAVIPGFYDTWPPGYYRPPSNPETQPPPAG